MKTSFLGILMLLGLVSVSSSNQTLRSKVNTQVDTLASVKGVVSDQDGFPIAGVKVHAIAKVFKDSPFREFLVDDSTESLADGSYQFTSLETTTNAAKGTGYYLTFEKNGYRTQGTGNLDLLPGVPTNYDAKLQKILSLFIQVTEKGVSNRSVAGANISLNPKSAGMSYLFGLSSQQGDFQFESLVTGPKNLTVAKDGYETQVIQKTLDGNKWIDTIQVQIQKVGIDSLKTINGRLKSNLGIKTFKDTVIFSSTLSEGELILFSVSDDSSAFAIHGIPADCLNGRLISMEASMPVNLTGTNTNIDFFVDRSFTDGFLPERLRRPGSRTSENDIGFNKYFSNRNTDYLSNVLGRARASH